MDGGRWGYADTQLFPPLLWGRAMRACRPPPAGPCWLVLPERPPHPHPCRSVSLRICQEAVLPKVRKQELCFGALGIDCQAEMVTVNLSESSVGAQG